MFNINSGPIFRVQAVLTSISIIVLICLPLTQTTADTTIDIGKQIYKKGLLPDGKPVQAIGQSGLRISGLQTTCANCHRSSGYGSSEGSIIAPAITGKMLYPVRENYRRELSSTRRTGIGVRSAYTDETLRRAIREGLGANGNRLNEFMPRFKLSDSELDSLIAYLKVLANKTVPGVTHEYYEFATIITPDVPEDSKHALLSLFRTYFDQINAGTRHETRRAENPPWHKSWHYSAYRKWRLHIWELTGKPESWEKQLEQLYQKQPIFALVNGTGSFWKDIHHFCESNEIPCLFPTTDIPVSKVPGFYSLYFSKGINLDAELIAQHIISNNKNEPILQVYRDAEPRAVEAKNTLNQLLVDYHSNPIENIAFNKSNKNLVLKKLLNMKSPYTLILWGDYPDLLRKIKRTDTKNLDQSIYLSTRFLHNGLATALPEQYDKINLTHSFTLPENQKRQLLRFTSWARINKISVPDERVMANGFFALTMLVDAIRHINNNISREYLIERIEHMVDNTLFHSVYPHLSLGPDQRYASKGGYIISYDKDKGILPENVKWIVP
jgi:mono/diheme cytochrome c family protein